MSNLSFPIVFGEVLYDCFPDGQSVLGGAPFNVAWHCHAFGLEPLLISRIGDDSAGSNVIKAMCDWGMKTEGIQIDPEHATGRVNVSFQNNEPFYDILENCAWDFINSQSLPELNKESILYHGSLALRNSVSAHCLNVIKKTIAPFTFVDINIRLPWWDISNLNDFMQCSKWLKINVDEINSIVPEYEDIKSKARYLKERLELEYIAVTQGSSGAFAMTANHSFQVSPENNVSIVDTVGAGDAFTSILLLGLHKSWDIEKTLYRAQQFASHVVGLRGAITQNLTFYERFIKEWKL